MFTFFDILFIYRLDEDAETDVLGKYIITLLSTDDNEEHLREHCMSQLRDFLSEETESFVNALFEAIKSIYNEIIIVLISPLLLIELLYYCNRIAI